MREDQVGDQTPDRPDGTTSRRAFLGNSLAVGAGAIGAGLLAGRLPAFAQQVSSPGLTSGDVAILRFLTAIELIEADLWQQYNELGGIVDGEVPGGKVIDAYATALQVLDGDMSQYIHDNTEDEISHHTFLNAYLASKGAQQVNLERFRTLKGSQATGARQIGRLTNLMQLTVDTSYWTRYRSRSQNPDLGGTFPPAVPGLARGRFPAIPRNDGDLAGSTPSSPSTHLQAIANTAG
ncbi:MAG: twin-arginine translocation signal domain-containing protein, partial [Chloroflexi bacterium]|nr:twin-arginine translocation signal domain-containing protein [Chloroflexota bacterium]